MLCGSNDVNWGQSRDVAQADRRRHERNAQETIAGRTWRRSPAEDEIGRDFVSDDKASLA